MFREMVIEQSDVLMLLVVGSLLAFLLVSTLVWALQAARGAGERESVSEGLSKARLRAAAVPFAVILVLVVASIMALFSSGESGFVRLFGAIGSTPIRAGLAVCAVAALVPAGLCVRAWLRREWRFGERLHYSVFVAALLLSLGMLSAVGI